MRIVPVEIFSDQTNAAVMRHPDRRFPGVLIQGDALHALCQRADIACEEAGRASPAFKAMNDLRNALQSVLARYSAVLGEHEVPLPYSE
jgi:hypothetical protein